MIIVRAVEGAEVLAVFHDVRDPEDFGIIRMAEVVQHVMLERAEALAEFDLLLGRHGLVADDQHRALAELPAQTGEGRIADRLREVDVFDLGADQRLDRLEDDIGVVDLLVRRDGIGHETHSKLTVRGL